MVATAVETTPDSELHVTPGEPYINNYTFSLEGLRFDAAEIDAASNRLVDDLDAYVDRYLKSRKATASKEAFVQHMREYAHNELTDLLTDNAFYSQSLLYNCDYARETFMPMLKERQMNHKRCNVCDVLMDYKTLDQLLSDVTGQETIAVPEPQPRAAQADNNKKKAAPAPVRSKVMESSKRGFDCIAGFYVNKSSADKLCSQLKGRGCDAYIIDKNGLYYVSMGSAGSRTEADALYTHIKEWYKGDVTIKQW